MNEFIYLQPIIVGLGDGSTVDAFAICHVWSFFKQIAISQLGFVTKDTGIYYPPNLRQTILNYQRKGIEVLSEVLPALHEPFTDIAQLYPKSPLQLP